MLYQLLPIRGGEGSHSKQEEGATVARRTQMKEMRQSSKARRTPNHFFYFSIFRHFFNQMQQKGGKGRIGTAAPLTPQQLEPFSPFPSLALAFLLRFNQR